ncbi:MAG: 3-dehydroquinate synthase [Bacteroidota bacterium]
MSARKPHTSVTVSLGKHSYPIHIGAGLLEKTGSMMRKRNLPATAVIISDTLVSRLYLPTVKKSLVRAGCTVHTIVIPRGEKEKSLRRAEKIFSQLVRWNIGRESTIVALGGGVVGDLSGFIAATYLRGVKFVQIPTTLLAQVDSSVGGKVGINHPSAKNMIGAFYQPSLVIADIRTLATLPVRELICGMGEVVKYGIILDKKFFHFTASNREKALRHDVTVLASMVHRSCELKALIVSKDEREAHLRAILNFGHTIGHAIEQRGKYKILKHGEAVLYGMIAETSIAAELSMIPHRTANEIIQLILSFPLPDLSRLSMRGNEMLSVMMKDKKSRNGTIRAVLPTAIGKTTFPVPIPRTVLLTALKSLRSYAS